MSTTMASRRASIELRGAGLRAGDRSILDDVHLKINAGEMVLIVGASGAGKTTVLRSLLGLVAQTRDAVWLGSRPMASVEHRQRAAAMAWLPQDMPIIEPIAVNRLVASARFRMTESRADREAAVQAALARCGVAHLADQSVTTLSGGERQRVALAAMLAQDAAFWLLDEPANHLDPGLMAQMMTMLFSQWQSGTGMVMISHQVNLVLQGVPAACHEQIRIVGMTDGRISWQGRLSDPALGDELGRLYGVPMRRVEVDGRPLIVMSAGSPAVVAPLEGPLE